ncbi:MAG: hypothetical protein ACQKBU_11760 [Verrucomicrobiales bacterium]
MSRLSCPPTRATPWAGLALWTLAVGALGQTNPFEAPAPLEETQAKDLPALDMLVEGSILREVILPQYSETLALSSVLHAERLVLVDKKTIEATNARIELYHPDESLRARVQLKQATLQDQRYLRSKQAIAIASDDVNATGTGLVYDLDLSRGFLYGPTKTEFSLDHRTAMNSRPSPIFPIAGYSLMAASALHAAELQTFSKQQLDGLDRLAQSSDKAFLVTTEAVEAQLEQTDAQVAEAETSLEQFLETAAVDIPKTTTPDLTAKVPGPETEMDLKKPATVHSKGGLFFDSQTGILVFLDDVSLEHPEFRLDGADEVKVFMEKNRQPQEIDENDDTPASPRAEETLGSAEFGEPTRIVATGTVVIERKDIGDGKQAKASGRQIIMDLTTNELVIRGGQPWILSNSAKGYVVDPEGYIRINLKSGDASFVGDSKGFIETDKPQP